MYDTTLIAVILNGQKSILNLMRTVEVVERVKGEAKEEEEEPPKMVSSNSRSENEDNRRKLVATS